MGVPNGGAASVKVEVNRVDALSSKQRIKRMNTVTKDHHHDGHAVAPSFVNPMGVPADMEPVQASEGAHLHALEKTLDDITEVVDQIRTDLLDGDEHAIELMKRSPESRLAVDALNATPKVTVFSADKWDEEYKVRIDALRQSVDELNARLDAFKRTRV